MNTLRSIAHSRATFVATTIGAALSQDDKVACTSLRSAGCNIEGDENGLNLTFAVGQLFEGALTILNDQGNALGRCDDWTNEMKSFAQAIVDPPLDERAKSIRSRLTPRRTGNGLPTQDREYVWYFQRN